MDSLSSVYEFRVRWEPFLLRPNTPDEGLPMPDWYKDPNNQRVSQVRAVGKSLGLEFSTGRTRFANTLKAHTLLEYAKEVDGGDKQDRLSELIFKLAFAEASMLQEDCLVEAAGKCGLDKDAARAYITNKDNVARTLNKALQWSEKGISGVPAFYINGQKMFSGAQEPQVFERMFQVAAEKFPVVSKT